MIYLYDLERQVATSCCVAATAIVWLAIGFLSIPISYAEGLSFDPSTRDLQRVVAFFEGEFDNRDQVWVETDARSQVPEAERHERIHSTHLRLDLPEFGEYVFYVEDYRDDDPQKVFRQRLVTFESARYDGVLMKLWFFKDPDAVRNSNRVAGDLERLTRADVTDIVGCDVYWLPQGDQYVGGMRSKACEWGEGRDRVYSQFDLVLAAESYWRLDRSFQAGSDKLVSGNPSGVPHKLNRARLFTCDVRFYGDLRFYSGSPSGKRPILPDEEYLALPIHNQGGSIQITRRKNGKRYTFRLNDKKHPYYETRSDFMFLSVSEEDDPFIAYSLHDRTAAYFGLHLGWMLVACERTTPPQASPFTPFKD